jgi:hypothetical protein
MFEDRSYEVGYGKPPEYTRFKQKVARPAAKTS